MFGYRSYSNAPLNKNTEMQFPMGMKYEKTWTLLLALPHTHNTLLLASGERR